MIHYYDTWAAKIILGILFPVLVLAGGFRKAVEALKDCWFQKSRGAFSADQAVAGRDDWSKLMKLIRYEK